ncbi:MAG: tetratricopeptide repeat protein [bacterium]|nr:tetratricopeptide repeat protein [bacterium]
MISKINLILAALVVAFFLYLSSINKGTVHIGAGSSGWEAPVVLLLFLTFLTGFLASYLITAFKNAKIYLGNVKLSREKKAFDRLEALLGRAKLAILFGNLTEGELILKDCISSFDADARPYLMLLDIYMKEGDVEKAFAIIDNIPPALIGNGELLFYKAKNLMAKGSFERAIDILKDINASHGSIDTKRLLRDAYIEAALFEDASTLQAEILKLAGKTDLDRESSISIQLRYELARKAIKSGRDADGIKMLKELIKKWPESAQPYVALGKLYWKKGEKKSAEESWEKGYSKTSNMIFVFLMEDCYLKENEPQKVIGLYKDLIAREPGNNLMHLFLGKIYLRLEMIDEALEKFEKAGELGLDCPELELMIGEAYFRKERFKDASERFKTAIGYNRRITIPFVCKGCGEKTTEWTGACSSCGEWDSLHVAIAAKAGDSAVNTGILPK